MLVVLGEDSGEARKDLPDLLAVAAIRISQKRGDSDDARWVVFPVVQQHTGLLNHHLLHLLLSELKVFNKPLLGFEQLLEIPGKDLCRHGLDLGSAVSLHEFLKIGVSDREFFELWLLA